MQKTKRAPSLWLSVALRADDKLLKGSPTTVPPQEARLDLNSSLETRFRKSEFVEVHGIHHTCLGVHGNLRFICSVGHGIHLVSLRIDAFLALKTGPNILDKNLEYPFRLDVVFQVRD